MKAGSESIEATLRRRILSAGFVARIENTRLPKCVMFGELEGGAGCVGVQGKEWMGCFLDGLTAFGINCRPMDDCSAAQDEGKWRRTAEQGAERFHGEKCIAAKKARARPRDAVISPNVTGRTIRG